VLQKKQLGSENACSVLGMGRDWCCMKEDQHQFLSLLGQLPLRLTGEQAGWVLNCQPHDIPALVSSRLLKPLGNPAQNGAKYFATADVLETAKDRSWLVRMTTTINTHWQKQNAKNARSANGENTTNLAHSFRRGQIPEVA